ncbi:M48 family metallopeptidase [Aeoliella sp. ICT_H6.2]|uniref:M48 family metallopeptidase n=1 Tax=Aeoliella straminimaris TaxID=2954799 RepID=A0A9X2JJ82_9BACT|nr:M48 family metallopeptidase [Aeoliella straminimaris]MCO6046468.1 M48 family metallopeptidase [Aeoliella straminimaris]
MATDFFERQSAARRNTVWLIGMFLLATLGIVVATFFVTLFAMEGYDSYGGALDGHGQQRGYEIPLLAAGGALVMVVGGTLFKVFELRSGGGSGVASRLGGRRLHPNESGLAERKLLNVVEEMAIASGVPVPPVFLMEEPGINAFAAGYTPSDAVVGVTRGAIEQLSREQLQGVIAHEFSHILNGDMKMSIRLIGILHGILLLGLTGQLLLRSTFFSGRSRSDRGKGSAVLVVLAIGLALMVLGFIGTFIGGLMKAAVSRQREYLADASAVQFTRNPDGIGGALKRIGAAANGSKLKTPAANEASHMFFAQGVFEGFSGLMATHPPLPKRILAIEPTWDGKYPEPIASVAASGAAASSAGVAGVSSLAGDTPAVTADTSDIVDLGIVDDAVEQVGEPQEIHRQHAAKVIAELPAAVRDAAREPHEARAVVYCLLLDSRREVREKQIAALRQTADPAVLHAASKLQRDVANIEPRGRLPLVDMCIPALRSMSASQFDVFTKCVHALVAADENLGLFEWTLGRIIERHLEPEYRSQRRVVTLYYGLQRLGDECSMLLATLAHVGHNDQQAEQAFRTAEPMLPNVKLTWLPRNQCSLAKLKDALDTLSRVAERQRGLVLDASAEVICADGEVKVAEAELLRGIADLLDCPVPPLIAGQPVNPAPAFWGAKDA